MPLSAQETAAVNRLATYYDGGQPYNPQTNPGGLRAGGHRVNFVPSLQDIALVLGAVARLAAEVASASQAAQNAAAASAGSAQTATDKASAAAASAQTATDKAAQATAAAQITISDVVGKIEAAEPNLPTSQPTGAKKLWSNGGLLTVTPSN